MTSIPFYKYTDMYNLIHKAFTAHETNSFLGKIPYLSGFYIYNLDDVAKQYESLGINYSSQFLIVRYLHDIKIPKIFGVYV